jgi:hypothetical protein
LGETKSTLPPCLAAALSWSQLLKSDDA